MGIGKETDIKTGLSIAKGEVLGSSPVYKFGNAPDFDINDGLVTIWDGADDAGIAEMEYNYSVTAAIDSISSDDNSDVQTIEIEGLDVNFNFVTQNIVLTGQTRKALTTSLIRVFRMLNLSATSLAGTVYCYENTALSTGTPVDTTKIRAVIGVVSTQSNEQTLMSIYTVPLGKTAYMCNWYASTAGGIQSGSNEIQLMKRSFGGVFRVQTKLNIRGIGNSFINFPYTVPKEFLEKTDIEIRVNTDTNVTSISGGFNIILVDNPA